LESPKRSCFKIISLSWYAWYGIQVYFTAITLNLKRLIKLQTTFGLKTQGGPGVITLGKVSIGDENKWKVGDNCVEIKEKEDFT
jgi:hypothetical protein